MQMFTPRWCHENVVMVESWRGQKQKGNHPLAIYHQLKNTERREIQKGKDTQEEEADATQSDKEYETARQRKQRQVDKITQKMEAKMVAAGKIQGDTDKTGKTRCTSKKKVAKEGKGNQSAPEDSNAN